jgi:hypothetical protein
MESQCEGSGRLIPGGPPPDVPMQCPECGRNVQVESKADGVFIEAHEPAFRPGGTRSQA